jgi:hypothetical protein
MLRESRVPLKNNYDHFTAAELSDLPLKTLRMLNANTVPTRRVI